MDWAHPSIVHYQATRFPFPLSLT